MAGIEFVARMLVLPEGMELDDPELRHFALQVEWRGAQPEGGRGGYAVTDMFQQLSRAGKWGNPQAHQQHQYRWETLEEALEMARGSVEGHKINGRTWKQWREFYGQRDS